MRLTKGFWMHDNNLDTCLEITKITYKDDKRIKFKAFTWNLGYTGNPWLIDQVRTYQISTTQLNKWTNITHRINIVRDRPGRP